MEILIKKSEKKIVVETTSKAIVKKYCCRDMRNALEDKVGYEDYRTFEFSSITGEINLPLQYSDYGIGCHHKRIHYCPFCGRKIELITD